MTAAVNEGTRGQAEGPLAGPQQDSAGSVGIPCGYVQDSAGFMPIPCGYAQESVGFVPIPCGFAQECEPESAPFLGPYLGLVAGVLCALVGAFLLLAPYAFDYRQGAAAVPRSTVVDLATGAGVLAIGFLTAGLFGAALVRRLRAPAFTGPDQTAPDHAAPDHAGPDQAASDAASDLAGLFGDAGDADHAAGADRVETPPVQIPQPAPEPAPAPAPAAPDPDPSGALRDLLTPLVAALAADLRAREQGGHGVGAEHEKD